MKIIFYSLAIAGALCLVFAPRVKAQNKQVVGWIEKVRIYPSSLIIRAKLDTGARNSSLNTSHITEFERQGKRWVRFEVTNRYGKTVTIERKVHRVVKIKNHDSMPQPRLAILLGICLGNFYKEVEVNLADRSHFNYQMLIGRSFLEDNFIIDSSAKYTTKPNCKVISGQ